MKTRIDVMAALALLVMPLSPAVMAQTSLAAATDTFEGKTYQVFIAPGINWDSARSNAELAEFDGAPGHLATITSAAEDVFIDALRQQAIAAYGPVATEFWVGGFQALGTCLPGESEPTCGWQWLNDEGPIPGVNGSGSGTYSNWLSGEPNNSGSESHIGVGLSGQFGWNDEGALGLIGGYIVEYEGSGEPEEGACALAMDPVTFQGNTYQVCLDYEIDWYSAREEAGYAEFEGTEGHLVTITSAEENAFVDSLRRTAIQSASEPAAVQFWTGGRQVGEVFGEPGGGWQWENGEGAIATPNVPVPGKYSNWKFGQPDNAGGGEDELALGIDDTAKWADSATGAGLIGGYIIEFEGDDDETAGQVPATQCQSGSCNPTGAMALELPASVVLAPGDTLTQVVLAVFDDPRVIQDPNDPMFGQCVVRRALDVFAELDPDGNLDPPGGPSLNGSLILPEFLCGSQNFAVVRSQASFEVLQDVVRSEQFPERIFPQFYACDDPGLDRDLQERGVFVWQPDDRMTVIEKHALELTNGCGSSKGAKRGLSYFILNTHIDCGLPFGEEPEKVDKCFKGLTVDKFDNAKRSLKAAKASGALTTSEFKGLVATLEDAREEFEDENYDDALDVMDNFIDEVLAANIGPRSKNPEGDILMRAENLQFMIAKIRDAND